MQSFYVKPEQTLDIVKEMYWLAWKACGKTKGMGFLQDRPDAMVKLGLQYNLDTGYVAIMSEPPNPEYQGWSDIYSTYLSLFESAKRNIEENYVELL